MMKIELEDVLLNNQEKSLLKKAYLSSWMGIFGIIITLLLEKFYYITLPVFIDIMIAVSFCMFFFYISAVLLFDVKIK